MTRRWMANEQLIGIKRKKIEECPSLDASFFDDEALTPGIVFTDISQRKWRLGKPIGRGSFGRIYLASDDIETEVTKLNARFVVKIEPHSNGPLFVEVHCLIRTGETEKVKQWCQQHRLKRLGMPHYVASGSFIDKATGSKYRFLVLPRYEVDLQKVISKTRVLDLKNVLIISMQIIDILEYLHSQGYTHSDIKSSNLMIGFDGSNLKLQDNTLFQKHIKPLTTLKKVKPIKTRLSNYYDDEDFKVDSRDNYSTEKKIANVRRKITQILTYKDRSILRNHAFNLRQLTNVNYEDINSLCSDRSYQKDKIQDNLPNYKDLNEIYKETIQTQSKGQVYLLDYGLASKFLDSDGNHKDFGMDARKAHDGTLEYSSRDSHIGAHSRRSDLETLGYNILDWLTSILPWKSREVLAEPDLVHALKKNFMGNIQLLLKTCFKTEFYPQFIEKYLHYITTLEFTEKPDYEYCRSLFKSELLKIGHIFDRETLINFDESPKSPIKRSYIKQLAKKCTSRDFVARNGVKKSSQVENIVMSMENAIKLDFLKHLNISSDGQKKPCASRNYFTSDADLAARLKSSLMPHLLGKKLSPKNLRSKKSNITKRKGLKRQRNSIGRFGNFMGSARQFTWAEILANNPEDIIRKERNIQNEEFDDDSTCKYRIRKLSSSSENSDFQSPLLQKDYLESLNPTYAMREVVANLKKKVAAKNKVSEDNILKTNSKVKCDNVEKLETILESPVTKPCTRSAAKKSESVNNSSPSIEIQTSRKSKNIKSQTKPSKCEEYDDSDRTTKTNILPKNNRAKKLSEIDLKNDEEKYKLVRKLPVRQCKVKKTTETLSKSNINDTISTKISCERKSLRIVLKRLDITQTEASSRKSPKKKTVATNRRKLRSDTRKKN